jgi:transaldolase
MNPLVELHAYGQSFWYDNIRRKVLQDGTLQALIDDDGLRGMTSNPSIFGKAIGGSDDYDAQMGVLVASGASTMEIYEALAIADIQAACDLFADLYASSNGGDGFVSLEVSPYLARDTQGPISEARLLFTAVNRPNLMIKVPATPEGIPAIRQLIGEGINVNVTLMFNMAHYEAVADAYIKGIRQRIDNGGDPGRVASVASFFVSRVDTAVDKQLAELENENAQALLGKTAVANSKVVYKRFREIFHGEAFAPLRASGAVPQRLLWASTSTKNPAYPPTMYVDELIGRETVNTMPPATIDAFRENGRVGQTLEANVAEAEQVLAQLNELGVNLPAVTEQLQAAGVDAFAIAFDVLLAAIEEKKAALKT